MTLLKSNAVRFYLLLPAVSLSIGAVVNSTLVPGEYEWLGLTRICYNLFDQTGFWCIGLAIWAAGIVNANDGFKWRKLFTKNSLFSWLVIATFMLWVNNQHFLNLPANSFFDLLALCFFCAGLVISDWHRRSQPTAELVSVVRRIGFGIIIFFGYTAIAYFHTMVKGSLFVLYTPNDQLLWKFDELIFGKFYYQILSQWRTENGNLVGWLDTVYIGLLQQMSWSIFYFYGARDFVNGQRYVFAMFLIYILGPCFYFLVPSQGPIFYGPQLFTDLGLSAPDTWKLSHSLFSNTQRTVQGTVRFITPFSYIAALPSLHVGISLIVLLAMRQNLAVTIFNVFLLVFTIIATNVLGWHYLTDIIVGFLLGGLTWWMAFHLSPLPQRD